MHAEAALCAQANRRPTLQQPERLTVLELERALFWGGLRFQAFETAVLTAVVAAAGCYYGGLLALNVMAGGYATLELERRYAWHFRQSELRRKRYAGWPSTSTLLPHHR